VTPPALKGDAGVLEGATQPAAAAATAPNFHSYPLLLLSLLLQLPVLLLSLLLLLLMPILC
jgi:hypothetical protein